MLETFYVRKHEPGDIDDGHLSGDCKYETNSPQAAAEMYYDRHIDNIRDEMRIVVIQGNGDYRAEYVVKTKTVAELDDESVLHAVN